MNIKIAFISILFFEASLESSTRRDAPSIVGTRSVLNGSPSFEVDLMQNGQALLEECYTMSVRQRCAVCRNLFMMSREQAYTEECEKIKMEYERFFYALHRQIDLLDKVEKNLDKHVNLPLLGQSLQETVVSFLCVQYRLKQVCGSLKN